jgi:hypothetical protein
MLARISTLAALGIWLGASWTASADDNHAILILDLGGVRSDPKPRMVKVEVDTGKVLAQSEVGQGPDVGVSPKGDLVAVLTHNIVGGAGLGHARVEVYRTSDLKRLESGLLPFTGRMVYMDPVSDGTVVFAPDGQEIIVQRMISFFNKEKPSPLPVNNLQWNFVKREVDEEGFFKSSRKEVTVPRSGVPDFLRVLDWPRVQFWNPEVAIVEAVDVSSGKILSRLPLDYEDDPFVKGLDPIALEAAEIGHRYFKLGANGSVIYGGGRFAYYLPDPGRNPKLEPGFIQKIDLKSIPPKVVRKGKKREPGLSTGLAAATDAGGAIFVVTKKSEKPKEGGNDVSHRRIRIYSTADLSFLNEIESSLTNIDRLSPSLDGKYMYALDRMQSKLAVIDVASGLEVKVLEKVTKYPYLMIPLPNLYEEK